MSEWVQHISGQGEKWEVVSHGSGETYWRIQTPAEIAIYWNFPKSEYHLCDPPETWVDVTEECEVVGAENNCTLKASGGIVTTSKGYRLRKVSLGDLSDSSFSHTRTVFIVEKRRG